MGMIISRTPLRMSFVGGGTDLAEFANEHGGAVVSTTVDMWVSAIVARRFEGDVRVSYSRTEIADDAAAIEHELVREAMRMTGVRRGVEIITLADVPSRGTGLGSSSSVTVGLLNALYAFQGIYKPPLQLAEEAAQIEIEILGKPIGRQDHYAAAVGGFNFIEFLPGAGGVRVEPVVCPEGTLRRVQRSLLLFYTGRQRRADSVLGEQKAAIRDGKSVEALKQMCRLAYELRDRLAADDAEAVGPLLHENWLLKQGLGGTVGGPDIDAWYERAREVGALGGKILGAGGGGFLLVAAPPDRHDAIRGAVADIREVPLRFTRRGTHISYLNEGAA
jgi:D-glycero-alpha-D-manno-heptose-7-phosphate kinase